jgi:MFS family permease
VGLRVAASPAAITRRRHPAKTTPCVVSNPVERKWWTLLASCIAIFMLLLDVTIVNVALPSIERDLGADFSDLQWVIDAYALTLAGLLPRHDRCVIWTLYLRRSVHGIAGNRRSSVTSEAT